MLAVQVFPLTQRLGSELKKAAQAVHEQTDRDDVRTMANMYSNNLESEMKRTGRSADVLALCDRRSLAHGEQYHCDEKRSPCMLGLDMCACAAAGCFLRRHTLGNPQHVHRRDQPAPEPSRVRSPLCVVHNRHECLCMSNKASFQIAKCLPA